MELQLAQQWLLDNQVIITGNIAFRDKVDEFFEVYNAITGEGKKKTNCGRCISNMKRRLHAELIRINDMTKYPIYRTEKGNLSFKEQGEGPIFIVRSNTKEGAEAAMRQLKAYEKRESKKIDQ